MNSETNKDTAPVPPVVAEKPAIKSAKKTIEQEIEAAAEKLRKLQEKQREMQKRERERNEQAVRDFIKDEKLEMFGIDVWRVAATEIRASLERAVEKSTASAPKAARTPKAPV